MYILYLISQSLTIFRLCDSKLLHVIYMQIFRGLLLLLHFLIVLKLRTFSCTVIEQMKVKCLFTQWKDQQMTFSTASLDRPFQSFLHQSIKYIQHPDQEQPLKLKNICATFYNINNSPKRVLNHVQVYTYQINFMKWYAPLMSSCFRG